MPPKAKAKAKAAAGGLRRPAHAKAKAKAVAKAAARVRGRGRMRRPAAAEDPEAPVAAPEKPWHEGGTVKSHTVPLEELGKGTNLVVENGSYFTSDCRIAGTVQGVEISDGEAHLRMMVTGTTSEAVLRLQSGKPSMVFRVHRCGAHCNGEAVADDLVHARTIRKMKPTAEEEGWTKNLEKIANPDEEDELRDLRAAGLALREGGEPRPAERLDPEGAKEKKDKVKGKIKKKKRKEKEKTKQKDKEKEKERPSKEKKEKEESDSSEESQLDGRHSRQAALKTGRVLYGGTGLDPREHIRARVTRQARRLVRKKVEDSSGSEKSSGSSEDENVLDGADESIFNQSSKVRLVAEGCPGALTSQAISQMRAALYQEQGMEDSPGELRPTVLAYFRQYLQRRTSGPALREMMTLASSLDCLLRNKPACAADILTQRLKAMESGLNGAHWTVSQRLEIVGQDIQEITGREEIGLAQKDVYQEAKVRYYAGFQDGRPKGGKHSSKGKETKDEAGKGKRTGKGKGDKSKSHKDS